MNRHKLLNNTSYGEIVHTHFIGLTLESPTLFISAKYRKDGELGYGTRSFSTCYISAGFKQIYRMSCDGQQNLKVLI